MPANGKQAGFTLIEILVVIAMSAILFGLITINLGQSRTVVSLSTVTDTLLSDIKHQQLQAMTGDIGSTNAQQPHGLYVQSSNYTLFAGSSYSGADNNNFVVSMPATISLTSAFSDNTVLFGKGTGDVQSFVNGNNTITINDNSGSSKVITIGRFGALTVN